MAQVLSFEFCEIFKNTFFTDHLWTTASEDWDTDNTVNTLARFSQEVKATRQFCGVSA